MTKEIRARQAQRAKQPQPDIVRPFYSGMYADIEALLSRDAEIREVLEGLAVHQIGSRRPCWCPPHYESEPHDHACLAARALYAKLQPKESSDVT